MGFVVRHFPNNGAKVSECRVIFIAGNQIKISLARFHKTFEVNSTLTCYGFGMGDLIGGFNILGPT